MQYYFSSDFHLGHANIIKYDKRPFKDVKEMDHTIISNCVSMFKPGDAFYYLGDFSLGSINAAEGHLKALAYTGVQMFFIKGNHDKKDMVNLYKKYGTYLGEQAKIKVYDQEIVLNHYAMRVWDKSHRGTWHLYGHSHHSLPDLKNSLSFDVGCNGWEYKPLSFDLIEIWMKKKTFEPIDHHGRE